MSSKADKTSHNLHQHRLSIFFRNLTLLKIVAWIGSLSVIGSTGMVWADFKSIDRSQTEAQALLHASVSAPTPAIDSPVEIYGPPLPSSSRQSSTPVTADRLPNREVPIAVTPGSASILPTGTIVRPQHTDILTADNLTVSVNDADREPNQPEKFITIPVPAPLQTTIPRQSAEIVTKTRSQVSPNVVKQQAIIHQSVPTTSLHRPAAAPSTTGYRTVPQVPSLPTVRSTTPSLGRTGSGSATPLEVASQSGKGNLPRTAIVTPMRPPISLGRSPTDREVKPNIVPTRTVGTASDTLASSPVSPEVAIDIPVPAPRTQTIPVPSVAQLPQITTKAVPTVPAIPTVRPAAVGSSSKPIAFVNTGGNEFSSELIYPLSSPAPTTSSFGWRTHPITGSRRFHSGVDIGAPMGAPVVAAGSGTIISAGWIGGYGKAIVIQHNGVQQTLYGHLSEVFVQPGQKIEQGTVIGRVGSTGNSTGPHLHFETRVSTPDGWVAVDPGEDIKYALDNLRRSMPFAQRDLPPGLN
jgi:murein DD-endopeptidase MepM/ murein hydrolase activator NlpD